MDRRRTGILVLLLPLLLAFQPSDTIQVVSPNGPGTIPLSEVEGQPMVPLRGVASFVGATVRAGSEPGSATISGNGSIAIVSNARNFVPVQGKLELLRSPVRLVGDEWFVPLDFFTKVLPTLATEPVLFRERERMLVLGDDYPQIQVRSRPDPNFTRVMVQSDRPVPMDFTESDGEIRVRIDTPFLTTSFQGEEVRDDVVERISLERDEESYVVVVELGERYGNLRTNQARRSGDILVLDLLRSRIPTRADRGVEVVEADLSEQPPVGEELPEGESIEQGPDEEGVETEGNPDAEVIELPEDGHYLPEAPRGPIGVTPGLDGQQIRIITLDPGHGGTETGAEGQGGSLEKNVVLSVSRRFRTMLETRLGVRVILTRDGDRELTLDERAAIANSNKSDLFVSIHADASPRRTARGSSVYFLSYSASDQRDGAPAAAGGGAGAGDLDFILWDMAQTSHLSQSSRLAEILQEELQSITGGERRVNRGIKQNTFRVLRGATMPAVLVELGFISNPDEERLLTTQDYQQRLAEALYRGVVRYKDLFEAGTSTSGAATRSGSAR